MRHVQGLLDLRCQTAASTRLQPLLATTLGVAFGLVEVDLTLGERDGHDLLALARTQPPFGLAGFGVAPDSFQPVSFVATMTIMDLPSSLDLAPSS